MNKISIIKKLQLGESSFPIDDLYSKVDFSFYCVKGEIKHQIILSIETSNLLDNLINNNRNLFKETEFQKNPHYRYQIYNSQECHNNYLIIFDISEHRDYFSCHVNTVFQIEFNNRLSAELIKSSYI